MIELRLSFRRIVSERNRERNIIKINILIIFILRKEDSFNNKNDLQNKIFITYVYFYLTFAVSRRIKYY